MPWSSMILAIMLVPGPSRPDDDPPVAQEAPAQDPLADAKALRDREEWSEAGAKFREALEKEPDGPAAPESRFWAGFCLVKVGENGPAAEILAPFEGRLAEDTWADDALLQLGHAYLGHGEKARALAAWTRQLEKYPESVWRLEVMLKIVDLHFSHAEDFPACLAACERVVSEFPDRGSTAEARYDGAYCMNVLRRFADSEQWAEKNFDPENSLEEAWRRVLGVQRDLLRGRVAAALAAVDSLDRDFPDLDQGDRQDLKLRTTHMLRYNGRADRARQLLLDELGRSTGRPQDEVSTLLDELAEIIGDDRRVDFLEALARLSDDPTTPLVVRVAAPRTPCPFLDRRERARSRVRAAPRRDPERQGRIRPGPGRLVPGRGPGRTPPRSDRSRQGPRRIAADDRPTRPRPPGPQGGREIPIGRTPALKAAGPALKAEAVDDQ